MGIVKTNLSSGNFFWTWIARINADRLKTKNLEDLEEMFGGVLKAPKFHFFIQGFVREATSNV